MSNDTDNPIGGRQEAAGPYELSMWADMTDGGIGEACYDRMNRPELDPIEASEAALSNALPDDFLVREVIAAFAEAKRRGLSIGQAIADELSKP